MEISLAFIFSNKTEKIFYPFLFQLQNTEAAAHTEDSMYVRVRAVCICQIRESAIIKLMVQQVSHDHAYIYCTVWYVSAALLCLVVAKYQMMLVHGHDLIISIFWPLHSHGTDQRPMAPSTHTRLSASIDVHTYSISLTCIYT